jgi:Gpi18-like mannosyltransferase
MNNQQIFGKVFKYFLGWRTILFIVAILSVYFIPVYGARFPYFDRVLTITNLPNWIWGFGGFDGVHYLRIAQDGYNTAIYYPAFFPVFPTLIKFIGNLIPRNPLLDTITFVDPAFFYTGLALANVFFLFALYFLYKLFKIDYDSKVSWLAIVLLLIFPTSFYFGSIYTESLFLLLSVLVLYESRKRNFLLAGIFCAVASATRIVGVLLVVVIAIELYLAIKNKVIDIKSNKFIFSILGLVISATGIGAYMFYLWKNYQDPIYFLSAQPYFGAQRSSELIFLPQVIYRYIKIFMNIPVFSLQFFNSALEFILTLAPFTLLVIYYKKIRFSYWIFMLLALIVPTLTGTFSSMPRYVLVAFPLLPILATKMGKYRKLIMTLLVILAILLLSLFIRGYWVA